MTEEKDLEGLGGWLFLVGIGIVFSPLKIIAFLFFTYSEIFSNGTWQVLTTPGTGAYNTLWGAILIGEISINGALIIAWLFIAFLFFTKKKAFPKCYIGILLFTSAFILIDAIVIKSVMPNEPIFDPETTKEFGHSLIITLIWVPYMLLSKRVKVTFVEKTPNNALEQTAYGKNPKGICNDAESDFNQPIAKTFHRKTAIKEPSPQSKTDDFKIKEKNDITVNENELYEQIWKEIEENKVDIGLWAKYFSSCDGDENKTKALYVKERVFILKAVLKKQLIDRENETKKEAEKEAKRILDSQEKSERMLIFEGRTENIDIFAKTLSTMPTFFPDILARFGCSLIQNEDRKEMWSIRSGISAQHLYNLYDLYDLRTEIEKIVVNNNILTEKNDSKGDDNFSSMSEKEFKDSIFETYNSGDLKKCKALLEGLMREIPNSKFIDFIGNDKLKQVNEKLGITAAQLCVRPTQNEDPSKTKADGPPSDQPSTGGSKQTGLPWGFVALSAAGSFLFWNKEKLGQKGGFIVIIGAIVLGVSFANMFGRK